MVVGLIWLVGLVIGFQAALSALSVLALMALIAGVRWPILGLFGIGMLCTLDPILAPLLLTGGLLRWNTINYLLLAIMCLHIPFLLRLSDVHTRFLQLFLLLLTLEIMISTAITLGVQVVLGVIVQFGMLICFVRADKVEHTQVWYWLGLVCGTMAGLGGMVFFLQKQQLPTINPNVWGFFPLMGLFAISLALPFARDQKRGQLYLILLASINSGWVFLSGSRGDLLIALCCIIHLVLGLRGLAGRLSFITAALLLAILISTQFADQQQSTLNRINLLFDTNTSDRMRTSGRSDLMLGGETIFREHPWGIGTGGFPDAWAGLDYQEGLSHFRTGEAFAAHAGWVKTLVENGIPGFLLLVAYVLSFAFVGWRRRDWDLKLLGMLVTMVLGIAFISTQLEWSKGLWFLAAGVTTLLHRSTMQAHLSAARAREPISDIIRPERFLP